MDPNIDPTIESQSIFDSNDLNQNNVFRLNDFDNIQQGNINIIQFNHFDNAINNNLNSNLLNNELINESINAAASSNNSHNLHNHTQQALDEQHSNALFSRHELDINSNSITNDAAPVSFVPFNPQTKLKRLGRPRKNKNINTPSPENSSSQNFNESIISKFRFDEKPIIGPGSRGGKNKKQRGRIFKTTMDTNTDIPNNASVKRIKKQSILLPVKSDYSSTLKLTHIASSSVNESVDEANLNATQSEPTIILEDYETLKTKGRSTAKEVVPTQSTIENTPEVPRTSSRKAFKFNEDIKRINFNKKNRRRRELPGPLLSLSTNLAIDDPDDFLDSTKLALGYKIKPSPWASDISLILLFIIKFKILFKEFPNLGPKDFENGLRLNERYYSNLEKYVYDDVNIETISSKEVEDHEEGNVSPLMERLFWKLLTLSLNRKIDVDMISQFKAIQDIKSLSLYQGYPPEWKNNLPIYVKPQLELNIDEEIEAKEIEKGPVDPTNPEILDSKQYVYDLPIALESNPFNNDNLENEGLKGIPPDERLTLLKILTQWSLSNSDSIKSLIHQSVQNQDPTQEKSTYYIARSIQTGKRGIEAAISESKDLIKKKQQRKLEYQTSKNSGSSSKVSDALSVSIKTSLDEIETSKFIEPDSNPLEHPMNLRLLNFFAGDCGVWGRFHFVRMDDENTGGLTSFSKMSKVWESDNISYENMELPSTFKLYVQNYNRMLRGMYEIEGKKLAYDEGLTNDDVTIFDPWYEVASNVGELESFIDFLKSKLEDPDQKRLLIKCTHFEPLNNLFIYLSSIIKLLRSQEPLLTKTERLARNKTVEYNDLINYRKASDNEVNDDEFIQEDLEMNERDEDDDYRE